MSVQPNGGNVRLDAPGAYKTRADFNSSPANASLLGRSLTGREHRSGLSYPPPLPAQSIRDAAAGLDARFDEREIGTTVFVCLVLVSPLALLSLCISVITFFS